MPFAKQQPGLSASRKVSDVLEEFQRLAGPLIEASVSLDFGDAPGDLWVYCDPAQLNNALLNLLLNARDAILRSGKGRKISVMARGVSELDADLTLRREHKNSYIAKGLHSEHYHDQSRDDGRAFRYVEFAVTDDGPGMADEVKRRAVDPFFTTKAENSGTGLGLSMVYGFVQQSRGELRLYSEQGHGTTVRMILPRGTDFGTREEPTRRVAPLRGNGEYILIVEDELSLLIMMEDLVSGLGYEVDAVRNGKDALDRLERGEGFDLIITDIVMPGGIDGFQLGRRVRELRPDMPLLYTSGYTGYSKEDMGEAVAELIAKPATPDLLAQAIHKALYPDG